jgi:hypothetical protein
MDHQEKHHEQHRKEREHEKHEHAEHRRDAEKKYFLPFHPAWLAVLGAVLVIAAMVIWTMLVW